MKAFIAEVGTIFAEEGGFPWFRDTNSIYIYPELYTRIKKKKCLTKDTPTVHLLF